MFADFGEKANLIISRIDSDLIVHQMDLEQLAQPVKDLSPPKESQNFERLDDWGEFVDIEEGYDATPSPVSLSPKRYPCLSIEKENWKFEDKFAVTGETSTSNVKADSKERQDWHNGSDDSFDRTSCISSSEHSASSSVYSAYSNSTDCDGGHRRFIIRHHKGRNFCPQSLTTKEAMHLVKRFREPDAVHNLLHLLDESATTDALRKENIPPDQMEWDVRNMVPTSQTESPVTVLGKLSRPNSFESSASKRTHSETSPKDTSSYGGWAYTRFVVCSKKISKRATSLRKPNLVIQCQEAMQVVKKHRNRLSSGMKENTNANQLVKVLANHPTTKKNDLFSRIVSSRRVLGAQ